MSLLSDSLLPALLGRGDAALALLRDPAWRSPAGIDAVARCCVIHHLGIPLLDLVMAKKPHDSG